MKTTEEMIEIMQAFVDGKEIEVMGRDQWVPVPSPSWSWGGLYYRIKPEGPKFKVGDYFVHNGKPHRVHKVFGNSYQAEDGFDYQDNIKPWTLEDAADDDWVIAWDDMQYGRHLVTKPNSKWENVVPYIGQAPDELI